MIYYDNNRNMFRKAIHVYYDTLLYHANDLCHKLSHCQELWLSPFDVSLVKSSSRHPLQRRSNVFSLSVVEIELLYNIQRHNGHLGKLECRIG